MNRNGTPAIILIYLMTVLPVFLDRSWGQSLAADATPQPTTEANLYAMFKDEMNATANFAQSEYDARVEKMIGRIYDTAAQILEEQLIKQRELEYENQKRDDPENANYAEKLTEGPHSSPTHDILPPAVAPLFDQNADACHATRYAQLIANQAAESGGGRNGPRGVRAAYRSIKSGRNLRPGRHRPKKIYSRWKMAALDQSSRPRWVPKKMQPMRGGMKRELPTKKNESVEGSSLNADAAPKSCGKCEGGRQKLQSQNRRKNLDDYSSWPTLNKPQKSEEVIGHPKATRERREPSVENERIRISRADSFPEVFAGPGAPDSSSMTMITAGTGLNEALRNANSLLATVPNLAIATPDDVPHQIEKHAPIVDVNSQIESFPRSTINSNPNSNSNLTNVMEKVLDELENLKEIKREGEGEQPEGSPCDILGTWNSETIGVQFHIALEDIPPVSRTFKGGRKLEVEITERTPPRPHGMMTCDTYLTGASIKQFGGPFYITAEMTEKSTVATFSGICRICGNIPTIFGAWTFVHPSKDCHDISLAVENKRDVLRKDTMALKRKHRLDRLAGKPSKPTSCSYG